MLETKGVSIAKGVVGQEHHQDGNKHLHAYVKLDKELFTRDCRYFDITWEDTVYHPNIKSAKHAQGSIKYCTKEDKEPLELGTMDYKQEIQAREAKTKILGKRLTSGESLLSVLEDGNEELIFKFKDIEANVQAYMNAKERAKPDCIDWLPNTWDLALPLEDTNNKRRHYWFWTNVPDKGKTTFLERMEEQYRCSWYNKSEVY